MTKHNNSLFFTVANRVNYSLNQRFCHGLYMVQYFLQRSDGLYLGKDLVWIANSENTPLYHSEHQDIALNQLIELNAKDINLRASVVACEVDLNGIIIPKNSSTAA